LLYKIIYNKKYTTKSIQQKVYNKKYSTKLFNKTIQYSKNMKQSLSGYVNTATPMHEMFMKREDDSDDGTSDSDSSSAPAAQVYRQRHISNKDHRFASIALEEAAKSTLLMQHGCIAVLSGKIIAKGCNNIRSHSKDGLLHYRKCCSAHAEICVLHKLCITELPPKVVQKIVLYIVRRSRSGDMVESAPCFHCTIRMKKLNIKAIVFSNSEGELEKRRMNEYDSDKLTYGAKRVIEPTFYIR
jgi:tRNA(Arg) A34 adenosine deaminase TadA